MVSKKRDDIELLLPELNKLDRLLVDVLACFRNQVGCGVCCVGVGVGVGVWCVCGCVWAGVRCVDRCMLLSSFDFKWLRGESWCRERRKWQVSLSLSIFFSSHILTHTSPLSHHRHSSDTRSGIRVQFQQAGNGACLSSSSIFSTPMQTSGGSIIYLSHLNNSHSRRWVEQPVLNPGGLTPNQLQKMEQV